MLSQTALLRCNSYTIQVTHLKCTQVTHLMCTTKWFLIYSQRCAAITTINFGIFSSPQENPYTLTSNCQTPFFLLQPLATTNLLFFFFLHWVFIASSGLPLVASSGGCSLLLCASFSLWWLLLLWSTGCRRAGFSSCGTWASVAVAGRLSCSMAYGIFLDQGLNPCPLRWQVDL